VDFDLVRSEGFNLGLGMRFVPLNPRFQHRGLTFHRRAIIKSLAFVI